MVSATLAPSPFVVPSGGAACVACRAPVGSSARYCLGCGARQAGARVELIELVPVRPAPIAPASVASLAATGPRTWPFALTAVVLVALVVGLAAGRLLADGRDGGGGPQGEGGEGPGLVVAPSAGAPSAVPASSGGAG